MQRFLFGFIFIVIAALSVAAQDGSLASSSDMQAPGRGSGIWLQVDSESFEQIGWWSRVAQIEMADESSAEIKVLNNGLLKTELMIHSKPAIERLLKKLSEEGDVWIPAITTPIHSKRGYVNWSFVQRVKRVQVTDPAPHDGLELTTGTAKPKTLLGTVDDPKQVARLLRAVQQPAGTSLTTPPH